MTTVSTRVVLGKLDQLDMAVIGILKHRTSRLRFSSGRGTNAFRLEFTAAEGFSIVGPPAKPEDLLTTLSWSSQ